MPRWKPDAAERLQLAALELFDEQGFERTTVAEITQRAELTQRTFFNHFADKREVLFGMSSELQQEVVREVAASAGSSPPLDAVLRALEVVADKMFESRRAVVARRHAVIAANPELQERELGKNAALTEAIAARGTGLCRPEGQCRTRFHWGTLLRAATHAAHAQVYGPPARPA